MVEDRITDGRRIAELLSSELSGLASGPLAAVSVVEADPDVTPTPAGARAYAINHDGERVGTVDVRPAAAVLAFAEPVDVDVAVDRDGLRWAGEHRRRLVVADGAAVKPAVDVLRATLESSA